MLLRAASANISACVGGTTLSSVPCSSRMGAESRSRWWIRRPLGVNGAFVGVPAYQAVDVARLKLVRVGRQCLEIGDPVLADARGEDIARRQGSQGCEAASAAASDCQPGGVGEPQRAHR